MTEILGSVQIDHVVIGRGTLDYDLRQIPKCEASLERLSNGMVQCSFTLRTVKHSSRALAAMIRGRHGAARYWSRRMRRQGR